VALARALAVQPQVLLLDEPTTGVDPVSRREFWDVLATLADEGTTIVVATPYLDEAERCNRIALMYEGSIQQIGTVKELRDSLGLQRLELRSSSMSALEQIQQVLNEASLEPSSQIADVQSFGDRLDILVKDPQVAKIIQKNAKQHGVDPKLVQAMIRQESGFNPTAVSPKGAMGLMQLMPETAASMGVEDPFDVEQNIKGGIRFLKICLKRFDQNLPLALAAYNAGPGRVVEHQGMPPFKETHTYVKNIVLDYCGQTVDPAQIKLGPATETKVAQNQADSTAPSPVQSPAPPINLTFFAPPSLEKMEALTISEKTDLKKNNQLSIY
jgi:hypothetical protein